MSFEDSWHPETETWGVGQCGARGQFVLVLSSLSGLAGISGPPLPQANLASALPCSRVLQDDEHLPSHLSTCVQRTQLPEASHSARRAAGPRGGSDYCVIVTVTMLSLLLQNPSQLTSRDGRQVDEFKIGWR